MQITGIYVAWIGEGHKNSAYIHRNWKSYGVFTWSSKRPAFHMYFEYICFKLARRLLDHVNTPLVFVKLGLQALVAWLLLIDLMLIVQC